MKVVKKPDVYEAEQIPADETVPRRIFYVDAAMQEGRAGDWVVTAPDGTITYVKQNDFSRLYQTPQSPGSETVVQPSVPSTGTETNSVANPTIQFTPTVPFVNPNV